LVPVTGRGEDFVLWELPYCRGLSYLHAIAVHNGVAMELESAREVESAGMREAFEQMRGDWGDPQISQMGADGLGDSD